ncbi:MAG TPA: c-type cytochrome, partial [Polyangiales bacterium]|nr:c-type cytochrome [Polyangiales bacterium]
NGEVDAGTSTPGARAPDLIDAGFVRGIEGDIVPPGIGQQRGAQPPRLSELRTAAKTPPAISGGSLAVDTAGTVAVMGDPDRDLIYVVDLTSPDPSASMRKLKLASGSEPGRVALEGTKAAHVVLRGTGKVAHVDLAAGTIAETEVCSHARGIAVDSARARIHVTCLDGQLVSLDAATQKVVQRSTDLPSDLRDPIVGDAGLEAVTRYRSAELLRLNVNQRVASTTRPRTGQRTGIRLAGSPVVVADAGVGTGQKGVVPVGTATAPLPGAAPAEVSVVLALSPAVAWRAQRSANGNVWMLHQQSQDDPIVVSQASGYGSGSGSCLSITSGKVTEFGPDGAVLRTMGVQLLGLSVDVALSSDAKWLAVASPGAYLRADATVQVYSTDSMHLGEAINDCQKPVMTGGYENQATAVTFDDNGLLYAFSREPAELAIFLKPQGNTNLLTRKTLVALDASSARDTGHELFHADVGQGLSCASCHGEALDDGHIWTFEKIGPRRTQNMRGGLLATAPFHWDGDMSSINHLVQEVMTRRMGGFNVITDHQNALGAWIDRQPALTLPARDTAAVARGKALFASADTQCATCHTGTNFTNNQGMDVGTGGRFQVPSLLGLALRAPYMHDGCAKTLEQRFTPSCGGATHGVTTNLGASQLADLVAYLKTL